MSETKVTPMENLSVAYIARPYSSTASWKPNPMIAHR